MTTEQPPPPGTGACLLLNSPLADSALDDLMSNATADRPSQMIDYGCGWGDTLLRGLERVPEARGFGVDIHLPDLERGRLAATSRGLGERATFVHGAAGEHRQRADLLISLGSYQAFGGIADALYALRADALPGARAIFGCEYWRSPPTEEELTHMWPDASVTDCVELPDLVASLLQSGWRIIDMHDTTATEFDTYEVGHLRERELWLAGHPDHAVRVELDESWSSWLRGHRRAMGFVTFVLA